MKPGKWCPTEAKDAANNQICSDDSCRAASQTSGTIANGAAIRYATSPNGEMSHGEREPAGATIARSGAVRVATTTFDNGVSPKECQTGYFKDRLPDDSPEAPQASSR